VPATRPHAATRATESILLASSSAPLPESKAVIIFGINNHLDIARLEWLLEEQHVDPLE